VIRFVLTTGKIETRAQYVLAFAALNKIVRECSTKMAQAGLNNVIGDLEPVADLLEPATRLLDRLVPRLTRLNAIERVSKYTCLVMTYILTSYDGFAAASFTKAYLGDDAGLLSHRTAIFTDDFTRFREIRELSRAALLTGIDGRHWHSVKSASDRLIRGSVFLD